MSAKTQEGQVLLTNVRCGYLKLFKPEGIKNDPTSKPRFGLTAYLPKSDTAQKARLDREIDRVVKNQFDGTRPKAKDIFISDGDGEDGDDNTKGHWIISLARSESQQRPQVINRDRTAILPDDGLAVAGYRYNVLFGVYKPKSWGKICGALEVVQFVAKDECFGAGPVDVDAVMPDLSEDADEDYDV